MDESGVDWAMDVHGDEAIPAVFLAGFEGIPSLKDEQQARYLAFQSALAVNTPDAQTALGYESSAPGKANLSMMSMTQLAERFWCGVDDDRNAVQGQSRSARSRRRLAFERLKLLAHACLATLDQML